MNPSWILLLWCIALGAWPAQAGKVLFSDSFHGKLKKGWTWVREKPAAWRIGRAGLEIRVEPGNMWGPANDARNVLVRMLPASSSPLEITATVFNEPTEQYEQVDLVCYADDSHMVKLGFELVDGKRCIVMGREEADRTRTIAIIPFEPSSLELRMRIEGRKIHGSFRATGTTDWRDAGSCEVPTRSPLKMSIQCYQGPAHTARWARISKVTVRKGKPSRPLTGARHDSTPGPAG